MNLNDRKLIRDIGIVLLIKLILLYGIWYFWVSGDIVKVDASIAAQHLILNQH